LSREDSATQEQREDRLDRSHGGRDRIPLTSDL
jgi:hypothetical protein